MERSCFDCKIVGATAFLLGKKLKMLSLDMEFSDSVVEQMDEEDMLCEKCYKKMFCRHAVDVHNHFKKILTPDEFEDLMACGEDWIPIAREELGIKVLAGGQESLHATHAVHLAKPSTSSDKITTMDGLEMLLKSRHDKTKARWNKNGIIQYKDEYIAILQRMWGSQVEFIIACSQVTSEGYRLMAIDEGKGAAVSGFMGGVNAYFYFQRINFVK